MAPTVQGTDDFNHGNFAVPGGASYSAISGTPAKDTSIVHSPEVASLLIDTTAAAENVEHNITGSPQYPWHGFWWRQETAEKSASNFHVARINAADGNGGRLDFQVSTNKLFCTIAGGSEFPVSAALALDTWHWIEMILDCGLGTRTCYWRVNGVDYTPTNRVIAASSGSKSSLGPTSAETGKSRYSNHKWGVAASVSDWLGAPASLTLDSCLPDADITTTGWTTAPLFSKVNDASDATVIQATAS